MEADIVADSVPEEDQLPLPDAELEGNRLPVGLNDLKGVAVPVRDAAREAETLPEELLVDAKEIDRRLEELEVAVEQIVRDARPDALSDESVVTVRENWALPEDDGEVDTLAIIEEDAMIELLLYGDFETSALLLPMLLAFVEGVVLSELIQEEETESDGVIEAESDVLEEARTLGDSDTVAEFVVLENREELAFPEFDDDDEIHEDFDELAVGEAVEQTVIDEVWLRALVSV